MELFNRYLYVRMLCVRFTRSKNTRNEIEYLREFTENYITISFDSSSLKIAPAPYILDSIKKEKTISNLDRASSDNLFINNIIDFEIFRTQVDELLNFDRLF